MPFSIKDALICWRGAVVVKQRKQIHRAYFKFCERRETIQPWKNLHYQIMLFYATFLYMFKSGTGFIWDLTP